MLSSIEYDENAVSFIVLDNIADFIRQRWFLLYFCPEKVDFKGSMRRKQLEIKLSLWRTIYEDGTRKHEQN